MSVLGMIADELPPTATYARRSFVWLPASPGEHPDGRVGTLTIVLQHSRRAGAKQESDTYAVDFEQPAPALPGVALLLVNETDDEQPDAYRVVIGPHGSCTCTAGSVDAGRQRQGTGELRCKHRDALEAVVAAGGLSREPV